MDDTSLTEYATEHREIPLLIRWTGERAVGLFEEWRDIEKEKRPDTEKMAAYHTIFRLYMIPQDEFGLYYMCFGKEQSANTELPPDMDPEQAKLIKDSLTLPYTTRLNKYIPTLQDYIREYSEYTSQQFYQNLIDRRARFHRMDSVLVKAIRTMNEMLTSHLSAHPVLACTTITDLFEEIPYSSSDDVWHHFDHAKLSTSVPFCTYSGFYKMLDDVPVKPEWSATSHACMTVYVQQKHREHCIYMYPDNVVIQSAFQKDGKTPDEVIELLNTTFRLTLVPQSTHQKKIQALCYIYSPIINLKLLLLFIYQDPLFSRYLFAEERLVVMKDKSYLYFTYYPNPRVTTRFISFTIRVVYTEEAIRLPRILPDRKNTTFMRVKIRHCSNQDDITATLQMLSLLFATYQKDFERITQLLEGKRIELPRVKETVVKQSTNPIRTGLVHGNIRGQPNAPNQYELDTDMDFYHVNITDEPESVNKERPNQSTKEDGTAKPHGMIFPLKPEADNRQYFYVCDDPVYPYINLRSITVGGKKVDVPYCFTTPHTLLKEGDEKEEKTGSRPIETGKTLKIGQLGEVLPWIMRWYQIIQPATRLIRRGISVSAKDSILYVLESSTSALLDIPSEAHINTVKQNLLVKLRNEKYLNEIMTEAYGYTREALLHQFEDGYIDPRVFYSFLCRVYNINIILFCKNGVQNKNHFYLGLPRYALSPTYSTSYNETVIVVINQGNEFNTSLYPLCEQVAVIPYDATIVPVWSRHMAVWNTSPFVDYIHKTQQELYGVTMYPLPEPFSKHTPPKPNHPPPTYQSSELSPSLSPPALSPPALSPPDPFTIVYQTLDEYGHVSWLHSNKGSIRCMDPIHSQFLPTLSSDIIFYWKTMAIHKLFQVATDVIPTHYGDYNGYTMEIDSHRYFFPVKYTPNTTLHDYRLFEKTSRYLQEYVLHGFSAYLNDHPGIPPENMFAEMDAFASDFFTFTGYDNDTDYIQNASTVKRDFSDTNYFYDGKHLTIPSDYVSKKLMYVLVNAYRTQRPRLLQYHTEPRMHNYYVHVWDFIPHPQHRIINGESAYLTYATHRSDTIQHGSNVIRPAETNPYVLYLTTPIRHATRWLMQYVSSVNEALVRYDRWMQHRVNRFDPDDEWEGSDGFHQVVWSSESTFTYYPYELDADDHALLSIVHVSKDRCLVQVMLPM
jgi:hypothetical protein